ncbi:MAG: asparaginase [Alphaproteobacteria bacterium]
MRFIHFVATGGTIASCKQEGGDTRAALSGGDLLGRLPPRFADNFGGAEVGIEVSEFSTINSFAIDYDFVLRLAREVARFLARSDTAGVVITQGTDTLEEVAFLLELLLRPEKPVVITGAQRSADDESPDGPRNLVDAFEAVLSAQEQERRYGVLVCFAGEIHAAREVVKTGTGTGVIFSSPNFTSLACKDSDGEWRWQEGLPSSVRLPSALFEEVQPLMRGEAEFAADVFLVRASLGDDGALLRCALGVPARGLIVEGFGSGDVTPGMSSVIEEALALGIVVVMATRCIVGSVRPVYGGLGGGYGLAGAGVIFGGSLSGVKLRLLVGALLGVGVLDLSEHFGGITGR